MRVVVSNEKVKKFRYTAGSNLLHGQDIFHGNKLAVQSVHQFSLYEKITLKKKTPIRNDRAEVLPKKSNNIRYRVDAESLLYTSPFLLKELCCFSMQYVGNESLHILEAEVNLLQQV